jgi:hypothetical protein
MNNNNPLAVELESENDGACEKKFPSISLRLKRRLQRDNDKDFVK